MKRVRSDVLAIAKIFYRKFEDDESFKDNEVAESWVLDVDLDIPHYTGKYDRDCWVYEYASYYQESHVVFCGHNGGLRAFVEWIGHVLQNYNKDKINEKDHVYVKVVTSTDFARDIDRIKKRYNVCFDYEFEILKYTLENQSGVTYESCLPNKVVTYMKDIEDDMNAEKIDLLNKIDDLKRDMKDIMNCVSNLEGDLKNDDV